MWLAELHAASPKDEKRAVKRTVTPVKMSFRNLAGTPYLEGIGFGVCHVCFVLDRCVLDDRSNGHGSSKLEGTKARPKPSAG
jgi:hypothetical protein